MTAKEIISLGPTRNRTLKPEDCIFSRSDGRMLERWAKDNGALWIDGEEITASSLDKLLITGLFCGLALGEYDNGPRVLTNLGNGMHGMSLNEALAAAKRQQTTGDYILLDTPSMQRQQSREMPEMEF